MVVNATAAAFSQVQWPDPTSAVVKGSMVPANTVATGGTILINATSVTIATPSTPAQTVTAINASAAGSSVLASLNSGGALVLTSKIPGSGGSVTIGASTGSIAADLGLVTTTITGKDATPVNIGGGQLQGLIDSRDQLLQERIDGVNALATRVIESVNSLSASGVGLDGKGGRNFFAGTDASSISVDPALTGTNGTDKIAASRMYADAASPTGYSSAVGDSSNALAISELSNLVAQRATVPGDLTPPPSLAPVPATLLGLDLSGAAANTKYTFTVTGSVGTPPTVTVSPGTGSAKITLGVDSTGNSVINVDTGTSRLTLSAPAPPTDLYTALVGLNGRSVTTSSGPVTIGDQYAQQIAALGVEAQAATSQSTNQTVLVNQLKTQRSSTSGVSLDEETINLITYQKAYQAAARVITVMDSMLDTLINNTGRAGR